MRPFLLLLLLLLPAVIFNAACSGEEASSDHEMNHSATDTDHADEGVVRVPNENGAAIQITSPANGATFAAGEQVIVEVSTDNFPLGETDNHWHVYVDGASWGMIMGGNQAL